jgi:hypothetical protein
MENAPHSFRGILDPHPPTEKQKYTMEYYSAVKNNEVMLFPGKWIKLLIIMLSKMNQAQKEKYYMFSHI